MHAYVASRLIDLISSSGHVIQVSTPSTRVSFYSEMAASSAASTPATPRPTRYPAPSSAQSWPVVTWTITGSMDRYSSIQMWRCLIHKVWRCFFPSNHFNLHARIEFLIEHIFFFYTRQRGCQYRGLSRGHSHSLNDLDQHQEEAEGGAEAGHHSTALLPGGRVGLRGGLRRVPGANHHSRLPDELRDPPTGITEKIWRGQIRRRR